MGKFLGVTLLVAITSGLAVWLFQGNNELTVGASGLIFGYFGYVLARGVIDRNLIDALAAVVMALSYAYILTVAIPGDPRRELDRSPGRPGRRNRRGLDLPDQAAPVAGRKPPGDSGNSGRGRREHRGRADEPGPSAGGLVQGTGDLGL